MTQKDIKKAIDELLKVKVTDLLGTGTEEIKRNPEIEKLLQEAGLRR
jgi:hypothetical protein